MNSYELFMEQKSKFVTALIKYDNSIIITLNPEKLSADNPGNWFMMYNPGVWGEYLQGFGVHFSFLYYKDKKATKEYVRLPVGVENPVRRIHRNQFKIDIVSFIQNNNISVGNSMLWPNVGFRRAKLLETPLVELNSMSWIRVLNNYRLLNDFNNVVSHFMSIYSEKGYFIQNKYKPA